MSTWADLPMAAFDLETTSPDPETARIVTATVLTINGGTVGERSWLADPGIDIPAEATAIHGITTEHAQAHGTPEAVVAFEVCEAIQSVWSDGHPLVIYNAPFDLTLLDRTLFRASGVGLGHVGHVIDPLVLDRACDRFRRGSRKLVNVSEHYRVPLSEEDAHGSSADALAAARVAWKIAHTYPEVGEMSLDDLQEFQAEAYRAWAANFQDYLSKQGKSAVIDPHWPIRPAPNNMEAAS